MSPVDGLARRVRGGFPRVSGDEPEMPVVIGTTGEFSPRERG